MKKNLFFTSDTHYAHANICKGTTKWESRGEDDQSVRDFKTLEDMNRALVEGINNTVGKDDILFHLGDWSFGGIDKIWEFRRQINCKTIYLCYGNHDEKIEQNRKLPNVCRTYEDKLLITPHDSKYIDYDIMNNVTAQELFAGTDHVYHIKPDGVSMFLSHYSHRVWNKSHHGRIHLYGHSHNTLEHEEWGRSMDVGVDAAFARFGEYRPFSQSEILSILNKRTAKIIDHHNKKTN